MTYIVNEACIKCKHMDCVEVCPVDCFYEGENMLVIHPEECIDCGVCEPECPEEAIHPDTKDGVEKWLTINKKFSEIWPNITEAKEKPNDAEEYSGLENKYDNFFSENPGDGD
ncbi:MAG: ferredoxin FdxA [Pseudomonadota bacterium]|nr:ferredoxin FdxA [Pseudomonadota bacterium]MED5436870.1 ferredoxin FdxA [Pseudomonadota bacterium]